jgi:alkylhydroperoxidase family enzyme
MLAGGQDSSSSSPAADGTAFDRRLNDMIEPLELYAHVPALLRGYAGSSRRRRPASGRRAAQEPGRAEGGHLTACEYCIDLGSQIARRSGLSDAELLELHAYRESPLFSDLEKLVLDYAVGMSRTPADVSDELFAELRPHFDDAQLVELTHVIALENLRGRFNRALGVGAAGFSEGKVCALPVRPSEPTSIPAL